MSETQKGRQIVSRRPRQATVLKALVLGGAVLGASMHAQERETKPPAGRPGTP
jgi:hypothetical protein